MKQLIIDNQYATVLIDFINNELLKNPAELEGIIIVGEQIMNHNKFLYTCFKSLNKIYTIEQIDTHFSLWFPHGILISPNDFSYEVVKNYVMYLSIICNIDEKELLFEPAIFFQLVPEAELLKKIQLLFENYKINNNNIYKIKEDLKNNQQVIINIDEEKILKSKMILNVTEANKSFLEFLIEEDVYTGNSIINYAGKQLFLLEYLLLRSLTASREIIKKLILKVNKENIIQIKNNIDKINISYLNNFKEQMENFQENMYLVEKKMLLLKLEEEDKSSGSSSKGIVKI